MDRPPHGPLLGRRANPLFAPTRKEDQITVWVAHDERPCAPRFCLKGLMEFDPRRLKLKEQGLCIIECDGR